MGTRCIAPMGVYDGRIGRKRGEEGKTRTEMEREILEIGMEGKGDRKCMNGKGQGRYRGKGDRDGMDGKGQERFQGKGDRNGIEGKETRDRGKMRAKTKKGGGVRKRKGGEEEDLKCWTIE